jgi:hypothetical protein
VRGGKLPRHALVENLALGLGAASQPLDGPFLLGMTPDLDGRLVCTRMHGEGEAHAVDARVLGGRVVVVYGGGAESGMFVRDELQQTARGKDGFFAILHGAPDAPPTNPRRRPPAK